MDTSNLNSQERQHLKTYANFLTISKYSASAIIITLILLAIFLL